MLPSKALKIERYLDDIVDDDPTLGVPPGTTYGISDDLRESMDEFTMRHNQDPTSPLTVTCYDMRPTEEPSEGAEPPLLNAYVVDIGAKDCPSPYEPSAPLTDGRHTVYFKDEVHEGEKVGRLARRLVCRLVEKYPDFLRDELKIGRIILYGANPLGADRSEWDEGSPLRLYNLLRGMVRTNSQVDWRYPSDEEIKTAASMSDLEANRPAGTVASMRIIDMLEPDIMMALHNTFLGRWFMYIYPHHVTDGYANGMATLMSRLGLGAPATYADDGELPLSPGIYPKALTGGGEFVSSTSYHAQIVKHARAISFEAPYLSAENVRVPEEGLKDLAISYCTASLERAQLVRRSLQSLLAMGQNRWTSADRDDFEAAAFIADFFERQMKQRLQDFTANTNSPDTPLSTPDFIGTVLNWLYYPAVPLGITVRLSRALNHPDADSLDSTLQEVSTQMEQLLGLAPSEPHKLAAAQIGALLLTVAFSEGTVVQPTIRMVN